MSIVPKEISPELMAELLEEFTLAAMGYESWVKVHSHNLPEPCFQTIRGQFGDGLLRAMEKLK